MTFCYKAKYLVWFESKKIDTGFFVLRMAHSEGDEILMSGEATGGGDSDEEIEVTAAEVLVQLENVSFYVSNSV